MQVGEYFTFAPLCGRHPRTKFAVGCEYPVIAGEIDSGFGRQGGQAGDEVHRFKDDMGGTVAIGGLQLIAHLAAAPQRCGT